MGRLCPCLQVVSMDQEIHSGVDKVKQLNWKNKKIAVEMECIIREDMVPLPALLVTASFCCD